MSPTMNVTGLISLLLSLILSVGAFTAAPISSAPAEEDAPFIEELSGVVSEYAEGEHMTLDTEELGTVRVNLTAETPVEADRAIQAGDYVYVAFDGVMTASLPPQIGAASVVMHRLTGEVVNVDADNSGVLIRTAEGQEVLVRLPEAWKDAAIDFPSLTAYFDGTMTKSLPGQIYAGMIVPGYFMKGVVEEIGEGFILIDADGQRVQVNTDGVPIPESLKVEDVIRVRYNGQMTRSIPAQIAALEILPVSR